MYAEQHGSLVIVRGLIGGTDGILVHMGYRTEMGWKWIARRCGCKVMRWIWVLGYWGSVHVHSLQVSWNSWNR
jgi:hypothetical protein